MKTYSSQWWEVDVADGWDVEREEDCVTICGPDGVGALQFSAYRKPNGNINEEDLIDAADRNSKDQKQLTKGKYGEFEGFYLADFTNDSFYRSWWLSSANTLLFVTYNCDVDDRAVEAAAVDAMVSSLRSKDG